MLKNLEHLQPGCPWYEVSEVLLPNIKWCEANLCSWIVNPANTWSNLAYLIVAFWVWYGIKLPKSRERTWLGTGLFVIGVTSFAHHAAYNFFTQVLDFIGMYYFFAYILFSNLVRLGTLPAEKLVKYWAWSVFGLTLLTVGAYFEDIPFQAFVPLLGVLGFLQELKMFYSNDPRLKENAAPNLKLLFWAIGFIAAAATCSALDAKRIWCDPNNHLIQGHAAWHVLSAIGIGFLSLHMLKVKPFMIENRKP
jgi:hypothetical protein